MGGKWHVRAVQASMLAIGIGGLIAAPAWAQTAVELPPGVAAAWDLASARTDRTATRERICVNGLWQWQPADADSDRVPDGQWGWFKVPGAWPGITDYMQKDCQTVHAHPAWQTRRASATTAAWHQRRIEIPAAWAGRRISLSATYVNSLAIVYLDGVRVGEIRFPAGDVDLTSVCRPGREHRLSILVVALPLQGVRMAYTDSNAARRVSGAVARRGLCGDVYLCAGPRAARIVDTALDTSVRNAQITVTAELRDLARDTAYVLRARVREGERVVREFASPSFTADDVREGRIAFTERWLPDKLWDTHTPGNQFELDLSLCAADDAIVDAALPVRFAFREFWISGRDFYLNGSRIFLCAVPLDNAQVSAAVASYDAARESLERLQSLGINFVYTHNYNCQPGAHLSFAEILRAADDVGMLVALSQPHFGDYDWQSADAEQTNGYADHAAFYVCVAGTHPSVVMYATSHNATGYNDDMNPDLIDGRSDVRDTWSRNNARRAVRAAAIIRRLDPGRIVYHHSSGNLGPMHTSNFYPNFAPIQELSDWFEHWATEGVKPFFACEYGAPFTWDWAMYRGWFGGRREFGSAAVPWDFSLAEWNAQFLGPTAYRISDQQRRNVRWESDQFRRGRPWHRWDYPHQLGSTDFDERYPVLARYYTDNWRAFRTWGVSAISPWEHHVLFKLRPGMDRNRRVELATDWDRLQRPGFSPDYLEDRYERMDMAYERTDWIPTLAAEALLRNNGPLLAYLAGEPGRFTGRDHNFLPGETVVKQIVAINNARVPVVCSVAWRLDLAQGVAGTGTVQIDTGSQARIPLRIALPADAPAGALTLSMTARFRTLDGAATPFDQTQSDQFALDVLASPSATPSARRTDSRIALFDPQGQTASLLARLGVPVQPVAADADLAGFDLLVVGKGALTADGPAPDLRRVPQGLKVLVFEQTAHVLERRLGFRVQEYGLRTVWPCLADHPILRGLDANHLRDWRGEATLVPPRLEYDVSSRYNGVPAVRWCGLEVPRLWRCGNRGNVASVLIEKPARGDFLPILDGGFSLQYSPLLEYREGRGVVLFCQLDVTGRTADEPAADRAARNMLDYLADWTAPVRRQGLYAGDPAGRAWFESVGTPLSPYTGGELTDDQVLVVASGGATALQPHAAKIARWLANGGRMLALELDAEQANRLLPTPVRTQPREHIAAWFAAPTTDSLWAGVGPADVHNRAPRELPLIDAGARAVGEGVLAQLDGANVVFCQMAPFQVSRALGQPPSVTVDAQDAIDGRHSALLTMGTAPWAQFGQKLAGGTPGKTYTFAVWLKSLNGPARVRLEIERAGAPWDRAVRGPDTTIDPAAGSSSTADSSSAAGSSASPARDAAKPRVEAIGSGQAANAAGWTELHVTFRADKAYPEGWQAYLHCDSPGARLRVDGLRLYVGEYVPGAANLDHVASGGKTAQGGKTANKADAARPNLLVNAGFEAGSEVVTDPWYFTWPLEQQNVRKTYRRAAFLTLRLLANLGVSGGTPLLERFATPTDASPAASIIRNGDFGQGGAGRKLPEPWEFSSEADGATCVLEEGDTAAGGAARCVRITRPESASASRASVMLAQYGVSVEAGQWYRLSLRAKASGLGRDAVTVAIQETTQWKPLFPYQRFVPDDRWKEFTFLVQADAAAAAHTRFQIWHNAVGTLWLSEIRMTPCDPPSHGRWLTGLYADVPQEWDDPYRFFRW